MFKNRRWLRVAGWLLLFLLVGALRIPFSWVLSVLFLWAIVNLVRALRGESKPSRPPVRGEPVRGVVEPPTARHAYKGPVTLAALEQAVVRSNLGAVSVDGASLRLDLPERAWAALHAVEPSHVTQPSLRLEGSSVEALALLCDALAPELGTMRLTAGGVTLDIDGTRPRDLLRLDVASALETAERRIRASQERAERAAHRPKDVGEYRH